MMYFFSLVFWAFVNWAPAQDISIPSNYVQQNQHTAFFFTGENSLITHCSLSIYDMDCLFLFEDDSGNKKQFRTPYERLKTFNTQLISALKKLKDSWLTKYPLGGFKSFLFVTRADDFAALEQIIDELETEKLHLRVLLPKKNTRKDAAYIYSNKRANEIFTVFQKQLDI